MVFCPLVWSDQIIARDGSIRSEGRGNDDGPGINWANWTTDCGLFLAYHGLCKAARVYVHRSWGIVGIWNAAGADDNSTGRRVSKADREGEGGQGVLFFFFFPLLGTGGDWARGDESATEAR